MSSQSLIADNLVVIRKRLKGTGLIAVSKGHTEKDVREALAAGQRVFGENRVQEAQEKFLSLRHDYPDIELHMIGPLQSNKTEAAVQLFDVIQTLDRLSLAEALAKAIRKTGKHPRLYIEINIGNEKQKAGIAPDQLDDFFATCKKLKLEISGLMCIPPQHEDPRPYFMKMRDLQKRLGLKHLSMGMSSDFETALACGATEVRVGTVIFGKREVIKG